MKIVLDTNILVSALLTPAGCCAEIIDLVGKGIVTACVDERMWAEYERVVRSPDLDIPVSDADEMCSLIQEVGAVTDAEPLLARLPHASDLPFLEVAAAAHAVLVTGNKRDFPKSQRAGVQVLSPRTLLDLLRQEGHSPMHAKERPR